MKRAASLKYEKDWYSPVYLRHLMNTGSEAEVRKEYTRLRDIAQKRLKRLEKAGYSELDVYKKNIKHYPKLSDIKSKNELSSRLADLARFISSERSTVSGLKTIKEKSLKTLHEHGYDFVTPENYEQFARFMQEYRYQKLDMIYDSGEAADTFGVLEKHHVRLDQIKHEFEAWIENHKIFESMRSMKKDWGDPDALKKRAARKMKRQNKRAK